MTIKKIAVLGLSGLALIFFGVMLLEADAIGFWKGFCISFVGVFLLALAIILGDGVTFDPDQVWRDRRCSK
jgi:drug/metabolite transporter (DMT)-like permease